MDSALLVIGGGTVTAMSAVIWWQSRVMKSLRSSQERVLTEEARVFDFLHGLSEALSGTACPSDLHALIVKGVLRISRSESGALYLAADGDAELQPAFVAKGCPPLMDLPLALVGGTAPEPEAVHRHLRIRHVRRGEGVLAEVWESGGGQVLGPKDPRLECARNCGFLARNVAVIPLLYGGDNFGVLVVARDQASEPYTAADMQVLQTIAEQSAFALCTAEVFSEAAEKRRLDHDLQVANEIQRILLPSKAPEFSGFQISGMNVPARHVSGDYYDFLAVDSSHCGVAIADVSGKGVPASLIMATTRSVLRSQAQGELSAAAVLRNVNSRVFPDIKEDMFISMAYVVLERDCSRVTLCRAGHDAPLLYRASDQSISMVNPPGMAVGIEGGDVFNRVTTDFSFEMQKDDCLILYTDGLTEALDAAGDEFGLAKVKEAIVASASLGASGIIERLTRDLKQFVGSEAQHDDITLIVIRKQ